MKWLEGPPDPDDPRLEGKRSWEREILRWRATIKVEIRERCQRDPEAYGRAAAAWTRVGGSYPDFDDTLGYQAKARQGPVM